MHLDANMYQKISFALAEQISFFKDTDVKLYGSSIQLTCHILVGRLLPGQRPVRHEAKFNSHYHHLSVITRWVVLNTSRL
jgi:hypothetical protein